MSYDPVPLSGTKVRIHLGYVNSSVFVTGTAITANTGYGFQFESYDANTAYIMVMGAGVDAEPLWAKIASVSGPTTAVLDTAASIPVTFAQAVLYRRVSLNTTEAYLLDDSFSFDAEMTIQPSCQFHIFSEDGSFIPDEGMPVLVTHDDYGDIFGGMIDQVETFNYSQLPALRSECQCIPWDSVLARRLIRLTSALNPSVVDTFTGGSGYQIFVLSYVPIAAPVITLNGGSQTVGYYGVDTGKDWYWDLSSNLLHQDTGGTPIGAGDTLLVTYQRPGQNSFNYYNETVTQIVENLISLISDEGFTTDVSVATVLAAVNFSDSDTIDSALSSLVSQLSDGTTNYWYGISPRKVLHFEQYAARAAPWNIEDSNASDGNVLLSISLLKTREKFANAVWMELTSAQAADAVEETFVGDGTARTFNTTWPMNAAPTITVDGVAKTTGIEEDPLSGTGKDWYWSPTNSKIVQDSGGTTLTSSNTLVVTYYPLTARQYYSKNTTSITARKAIEGGSGETDEYYSISTPVTLVEGDNPATRRATLLAEVSRRMTVKTYRGGMDINLAVGIELSQFKLTLQTFMVESVKISISNKMAVWTVVLAAGAIIGGYRTAFKNWGKDVVPLSAGAGAATPISTPTAAPGALVYKPLLTTSGYISVMDVAVSTPNAIQGIDFQVIAFDELACDPTTGAWYTGGAIDAVSDPVIGTLTKNPNCTVDFNAAVGDWICWADPGKFEWAQITAITPGSPEQWTIQRHYPGAIPSTKATFESYMAAHDAGVKIFVVRKAAKRFILGAQDAGYDTAAVPTTFDMPLPSHCVGAIVAAPFNAYGYGDWVVYNCATATVPGIRTFIGGEFDLPFSGALSANAGVNRQISISVDLTQPIRVCHARVDTAPAGADIQLKVRRSADSGVNWTDLYDLTIADGENISWPSASPPEKRTEPYTGTWPYPILTAGELLNFSIEQVGSTVAGSGLMIKINT